MDDIVVYGCTQDDHDSRLDIVLKKLSSAGITLNKEKCPFKQSEISFLGQIIGAKPMKTLRRFRLSFIYLSPKT